MLKALWLKFLLAATVWAALVMLAALLGLL
jgi:hypothetical protein